MEQEYPIVVNGIRYRANRNPNGPKGFFGRPYTIRFLNGAILQTNDLEFDFAFKSRSHPDTAQIVAGWQNIDRKTNEARLSAYW